MKSPCDEAATSLQNKIAGIVTDADSLFNETDDIEDCTSSDIDLDGVDSISGDSVAEDDNKIESGLDDYDLKLAEEKVSQYYKSLLQSSDLNSTSYLSSHGDVEEPGEASSFSLNADENLRDLGDSLHKTQTEDLLFSLPCKTEESLLYFTPPLKRYKNNTESYFDLPVSPEHSENSAEYLLNYDTEKKGSLYASAKENAMAAEAENENSQKTNDGSRFVRAFAELQEVIVAEHEDDDIQKVDALAIEAMKKLVNDIPKFTKFNFENSEEFAPETREEDIKIDGISPKEFDREIYKGHHTEEARWRERNKSRRFIERKLSSIDRQKSDIMRYVKEEYGNIFLCINWNKDELDSGWKDKVHKLYTDEEDIADIIGVVEEFFAIKNVQNLILKEKCKAEEQIRKIEEEYKERRERIYRIADGSEDVTINFGPDVKLLSASEEKAFRFFVTEAYDADNEYWSRYCDEDSLRRLCDLPEPYRSTIIKESLLPEWNYWFKNLKRYETSAVSQFKKSLQEKNSDGVINKMSLDSHRFLNNCNDSSMKSARPDFNTKKKTLTQYYHKRKLVSLAKKKDKSIEKDRNHKFIIKVKRKLAQFNKKYDNSTRRLEQLDKTYGHKMENENRDEAVNKLVFLAEHEVIVARRVQKFCSNNISKNRNALEKMRKIEDAKSWNPKRKPTMSRIELNHLQKLLIQKLEAEKSVENIADIKRSELWIDFRGQKESFGTFSSANSLIDGVNYFNDPYIKSVIDASNFNEHDFFEQIVCHETIKNIDDLNKAFASASAIRDVEYTFPTNISSKDGSELLECAVSLILKRSKYLFLEQSLHQFFENSFTKKLDELSLDDNGEVKWAVESVKSGDESTDIGALIIFWCAQSVIYACKRCAMASMMNLHSEYEENSQEEYEENLMEKLSELSGSCFEEIFNSLNNWVFACDFDRIIKDQLTKLSLIQSAILSLASVLAATFNRRDEELIINYDNLIHDFKVMGGMVVEEIKGFLREVRWGGIMHRDISLIFEENDINKVWMPNELPTQVSSLDFDALIDLFFHAATVGLQSQNLVNEYSETCNSLKKNINRYINKKIFREELAALNSLSKTSASAMSLPEAGYNHQFEIEEDLYKASCLIESLDEKLRENVEVILPKEVFYLLFLKVNQAFESKGETNESIKLFHESLITNACGIFCKSETSRSKCKINELLSSGPIIIQNSENSADDEQVQDEYSNGKILYECEISKINTHSFKR